jgi:hypothetical protein
MKRGPLSNSDKDYIAANHKKKPLATLVKKLQKSENLISAYINILNNPPQQQTSEENTTGKQTVVDTSKLFINHRGATVMTPNASSISDQNKSVRKPSGVKYMKDCVYKIKPEKT